MFYRLRRGVYRGGDRVAVGVGDEERLRFARDGVVEEAALGAGKTEVGAELKLGQQEWPPMSPCTVSL